MPHRLRRWPRQQALCRRQSPPRLRPKASACGSPFGFCRMLMGADDGAIDDVQTPVEPTLGIDLSLQRSEDAIPHPGLLLPGEARRDRLPRAVTLGQGAPGAAGAQEPENAVGDAAMVVVRTTGAPQAWLRRVATSVARAVSAARRKRRCVQASTRLPSWQVTSWCIRTSAVQAG
jgi:hypothetical protein